jgi:ATP-binding cassette, subfamily B, bacterial
MMTDQVRLRGGMITDIGHAVRLLLGTSFRQQPGQTIVACLGVLGSALVALTALWAGLIVQATISHDGTLAVVGVVALVGTVAINWSIGLAAGGARITLAEQIGFELDRRIAVTTASMPGIAHFERPDIADEIQILRQNRGILGGGLSSLLYNVDTIVMAIVTLTMVGLVDPRLLFLALTAVPALVGSRARYRRTQAAEVASAPVGRLVRHLTDRLVTPQAAMELRVFGAGKAFRKRLHSTVTAWRRPVVAAEKASAWISFVEDALFTLVLGIVIVGLVWAAAKGRASASAVVIGVVAARQIQQAMVSTVDGVGGAGGLIDTARLVRRIRWLEAIADQDRHRHSGTLAPPSRLQRGIQLRDVAFAYESAGRPAVENLTVELAAGSTVAIVGENGAGKSTLVKLLIGLYQPTQGSVVVDGVDLRDLDLEAWHEQTTAAFQDHAILELLVRETVGVGDLTRIDDLQAVSQAVHNADANAIVAHLPNGLDTQLGTSWADGVGLSGGQWQRLALARGQMRPAPLLMVLDEPTASLDAHSERAMFQRFTQSAARAGEARGAVTLLVTHRFSTTREADQILVLHHGRLIEHGTHAELMALDGHYAELYKLQAAGYR